MIDCFVDVGEIVDHHSLNFLFIQKKAHCSNSIISSFLGSVLLFRVVFFLFFASLCCVSLDCPFLITNLIFSNVHIKHNMICMHFLRSWTRHKV